MYSPAEQRYIYLEGGLWWVENLLPYTADYLAGAVITTNRREVKVLDAFRILLSFFHCDVA